VSKRFYFLAVCCSFSVSLLGQSLPTAEGPHTLLWMGATFSSFNPDYGCTSASPFTCWGNHAMGISPYAVTRPILFNRIGIAGQARFLNWHGPNGLTENSYMAGPHFRLANYRACSFSVTALFGTAHLHVPPPQVGEGTYFAYAPGGAVDYRMARRVSLRLEYEYQIWPSFSGLNGRNGLTPNGLSVGFGYAIR